MREDEPPNHEMLRPEMSDLMLPYTNINDMPLAPLLWGLFDYELFELNLNKLRRIKPETPEQVFERRLISDKAVAPFREFLRSSASWRDVRTQIANELSIPNDTQIVPSIQITNSLRLHFEQSQGDIVLLGTPHSLLYSIHQALNLTSLHSNINVAELVFDKHIDTVVNPHFPFVTSANVYHYLERSELLQYPVILGPDFRLRQMYKNSDYFNQTRSFLVGVDNDDTSQDYDTVLEVLRLLKDRGITNITVCVDLDVLSENESAFAVRYSPLMHLLGLGCQYLPNRANASHLDAVTRVVYPTSHVHHFLQRGVIIRSQDPSLIRQLNQRIILFHHEKSASHFANDEMKSHIGEGEGLPLSRVVSFISHLKRAIPQSGIEFGINLKGGGHYAGSIVELMGFDDSNLKTVNAALAIREALLSNE